MIKLQSKTLRAWIAPQGATLVGLWHADWSQCLVLGSPDLAAYTSEFAYCGAVVGPVANRVSGAAIDIEGTIWRMTANEGTTCLHSGPNGLHARVWEISKQTSDSVTLTCVLRDGECGLPGQRDIALRYQLDDAAMTLEIRATTDRPTVMNLAHHPYWNLAGSGDISTHKLEVAANTFLPVDGDTLPTGDVASVCNTPYDFRKATCLPTDFTLDANLCLSSHRRAEPHFAARLTAPHAPLMEIHTTEPGLQIYNGSGLCSRRFTLHNGQNLAPYAGVALEPQAWPDAPNHAHFPSINVNKETAYRQITRYEFSNNLAK